MNETLENTRPFSFKLLKINRTEIYEPKALPTFLGSIPRFIRISGRFYHSFLI